MGNKWSKKHWKIILILATVMSLFFWLIGEPDVILMLLAATIGIFISSDSKITRTTYSELEERYPNKHFNKHSYSFGKYITMISYYFMIADGKIGDKEMTYYLQFLKDEFESNYRTKRLLKLFNSFNKSKFTLKITAKRLLNKMSKRERVKLLHYLVSLITQDKFLSVEEIALLRKLCKYIEIHPKTLESVLALHNYTSEEDENKRKYAKKYTSASFDKYYTILGIDKSANENEIKTAYRSLAKLYHPDKQKEVTATTRAKFQSIQEAYEKVKEKKGFS